jgi:fluoride exporter
MIQSLPYVALGGALGASARYLVNAAALRMIGAGFPWATLAVNVFGSFLMGVMIVSFAHKDLMRFAPLVMTGMLGGFTTFSAFSLDAVTLWQRGEVLAATGYVAGSVIASLLALLAGMALARMVLV